MSTSNTKPLNLVLVIALVVIVFFFFAPVILFFVSRLAGIVLGPGEMAIMSLGHVGMPFRMGLPPVMMTFIPTLFLFIIWLFVSIWVYNDAEHRNMSGILWALLVFVGNIIGLLIYLIVRSSVNNPFTPVASTKKCPSCSKPIKDEFMVCPYCGAELQQSCPSCGKSIDQAWKVCPYCGNQLT